VRYFSGSESSALVSALRGSFSSKTSDGIYRQLRRSVRNFSFIGRNLDQPSAERGLLPETTEALKGLQNCLLNGPPLHQR
jgi:hypothetical protein